MMNTASGGGSAVILVPSDKNIASTGGHPVALCALASAGTISVKYRIDADKAKQYKLNE